MVLRFNRFIYLILGKKQTLYLSAYFFVDQVGVPPALRLPAELRRINFSSPYYCGPGGSRTHTPFEHNILSVACIPIPPLVLIEYNT